MRRLIAPVFCVRFVPACFIALAVLSLATLPVAVSAQLTTVLNTPIFSNFGESDTYLGRL